MKKILFFATVLTGLLFTSCQSKNESSESVTEEVILKFMDSEISKDLIEIKKVKDVVTISNDDLLKFYKYFNKQFNTDVDRLFAIKLSPFATDSYNLEFYLQESKTDKNIPFAIILERNGSNYIGSDGTEIPIYGEAM